MTRRLAIGQSVALAVWFVLLWVGLWADLSVANVVSGLVVAIVAIWLAERISGPARQGRARISPVGLVVFVVHVLWSLVKSNLFLAWEIVTPTNTIATGTVEVPLRSPSAAIAMAVSNVVTLTPGTVTLGVADDSSSLTIGVLHLSDPAAVRRSVQHTERLAIRAFGTRAARQTLGEEAR
jgi:multicomponent Na+:H+ antiporter subunit E